MEHVFYELLKTTVPPWSVPENVDFDLNEASASRGSSPNKDLASARPVRHRGHVTEDIIYPPQTF